MTVSLCYIINSDGCWLCKLYQINSHHLHLTRLNLTFTFNMSNVTETLELFTSIVNWRLADILCLYKCLILYDVTCSGQFREYIFFSYYDMQLLLCLWRSCVYSQTEQRNSAERMTRASAAAWLLDTRFWNVFNNEDSHSFVGLSELWFF